MSWQAASFALLGLVLVAGFAWFEVTRPPAKVVSLVATMAALAVVGRIAFAPFPNVKPTTDIVLLAGFAIGAAPGFAVGAITALASNIFFGQGPWTPWQMVAWGLVGLAGGLLARITRGREPRRIPLALVCALAGFGYGALLDVYQWTLSATHNLASYVAIAGTSFPYNLAHAVGNFVFALAIGPAFVRALRRYRRRFEVRWEAPVLIAMLLLALLAPAALAGTPKLKTIPLTKGLRYIDRAQNPDGGFGGAPGQSSSPLYTGWVTLGIAAAGDNPRDMTNGKATPVSYMRKHLPGPKDVGELERTILALRASGVSPRRFGGRDLVADLQALRRPNGSWDGLVDHTAFGVLALRASGASTSAVRASALWLERQQNGDGGFGFGPKGGSSDSDDTGSSIQALVAAGRRRKPAVGKAVSYLRQVQHADGGFGQMKGDTSNAQSTSWAIQGLVAAGRDPNSLRKNGRTPTSYLTSLQQANGAVRYSRTSAQTPVWVTGEALAAFAQKPFPISPPKRRPVRLAKASARSHKARTAVPIAHAATKKQPTNAHGQTIHPIKKKTTRSVTPTPTPAATPLPKATSHKLPAPRRPLPSTTHETKSDDGDLGLALGGLALATILAGTYLTRRRLRGRSRVA